MSCRRRARGGVACRGGANTAVWWFHGSRGPGERLNNTYRFTIDQLESRWRTSRCLAHLRPWLADRRKTAPCSCLPSPERRPPLCNAVSRLTSKRCCDDATANTTSLMSGIYSGLPTRSPEEPPIRYDSALCGSQLCLTVLFVTGWISPKTQRGKWKRYYCRYERLAPFGLTRSGLTRWNQA